MRRRVRVYHDERRFERVDEDEEVVVDDEEVVEEDEEVVEEDEEVVEEDEVVVGRPRGDPVAEYLYGLTGELPRSLGEWSVPWLLAEMRKADALGDAARARRAARLVYQFCPAKPQTCPLFTLSKCPYGLEKRCRGFAQAERRRIEKPKKWRRWYY
ncbi:MAG: hypothetical protein LM580_08875 [Thermofilum sp.]|nr:hypothetical protein [Thermofilum sp.]